MMRVVYRWRVAPANVEKFRAAWAKATTGIRESTRGARGSVLLQSHDDPTEFITMARWDDVADWQAFWQDSTRTEMQVMHVLAQRLSADAFEEIEDHSV